MYYVLMVIIFSMPDVKRLKPLLFLFVIFSTFYVHEVFAQQPAASKAKSLYKPAVTQLTMRVMDSLQLLNESRRHHLALPANGEQFANEKSQPLRPLQTIQSSRRLMIRPSAKAQSSIITTKGEVCYVVS